MNIRLWMLTAILTLCSATKSVAQYTYTNEGDLRAAVNNGGLTGTIVLGDDIELTNRLNVGYDGDLGSELNHVTIDLNGHTLSRSLSAADDGGQVISVFGGWTLTIKDSSGDNSGKITGGWSYQGGAIYVYPDAQLTIEGGTITGNRADTKGSGYGFGGGVENHGTMTMTGGKITSNTAGQFGGGIYQAGTFNIQGNPVVDDLYLTSYSLITLTGPLTTGASIGLNAEFVCQTHFTVNYSQYHAGTAPDTYFTSKNNNFDISLNANGEVVYGVRYIERAWDDNAKKVTETIKSCTTYTPINGNDTSDEGWMPLYDGWYAVTGNSSYKTLNVLGSDVKLIIPDGVTLTVTGGVKLLSGHELTIYSQGGDVGQLTVNNVYDGGAGIGSGGKADDSAGLLVVHGGIVNATGNKYGAGIGGSDTNSFNPWDIGTAGHESEYGGLVVYGGTVNAQGGEYAAGIGSGDKPRKYDYGHAGHVTIYGGTVTATGGSGAAGIGGGRQGHGAILDVYGGTVNVFAGEKAAAIGGGNDGNGYQVCIYGGIVTARADHDDSSAHGAGIGGGNGAGTDGAGNGGNIFIYGGTVEAQGGDFAAGIGCGFKGEEAHVTISGGTVKATGGYEGSGIGGSAHYSPSLNIDISGGDVTATSHKCAAGIGSGYYGNFLGTISISGGKVHAQVITSDGDKGHASGIGCGQGGKFQGTVNITGGDVEAEGMDIYSAIGDCLEFKTVCDVRIYDGCKVITGRRSEYMEYALVETTLQKASDRQSAIKAYNYAHIEPCDHPGSVYTISGTSPEDTHLRHCAYCSTAFSPEKHTFDSDGKCTVCGVEGDVFIVTVYLPKGEGTTDGEYEATTFKVVPKTKFKLPASPTFLNGLEFAGWLLGTHHNNSYIASDSESLLEEGKEYIIIGNATFTARYRSLDISLADNASNLETLMKYNGMTAHSVTLSSRTLYKDGRWNTLCLPFAVSDFTGTPLEGATVKSLSTAAFADGTLTLNFSDNLTAIEAGKPYIVKWDNSEDTEIVSPVFNNVTISNTSNDVETNVVTFSGIFSPYAIEGEDRTMLYLGGDNKLYYPNGAMTIGACRAYFKLADGLTAGEPTTAGAQGVKAFALNFDDEATCIRSLTPDPSPKGEGSDYWYTLDGRRLTGKPTQKGIYINNGNKVVIK